MAVVASRMNIRKIDEQRKQTWTAARRFDPSAPQLFAPTVHERCTIWDMGSLERLAQRTYAPAESPDAARGTEETIERQEPFDYQIVAAEKSIESLEKTGVALVDMATGLGKTRVSI